MAASQGGCPAVLLVAARDAVKIEQEPIGDPNGHIQDVTVHKTLGQRALLVHIAEQNLLVGKFWNKPVAETVCKGSPVLESGDGSGPRPDWERRRVPEGLVEKPAEGSNTVIETWIEIAESLRQKCERNIQQPILDKAGRQILDEHALDIGNEAFCRLGTGGYFRHRCLLSVENYTYCCSR